MVRLISKKGVVIIEFAAILAVLAIASFLGFTYVNHQQKLASSQQPQPSQQEPAAQKVLAPSDITPIKNARDIDSAHEKLNQLENDLNDIDDASLVSDINTITAQND